MYIYRIMWSQSVSADRYAKMISPIFSGQAVPFWAGSWVPACADPQSTRKTSGEVSSEAV